MSDLDLEAISERADAAVRGPWHVEYFGDSGYPQRIANDAAVLVADTHEGGGYPARTAEFIAAARSDVPALIAEVERLRAQLDEVKALHTDSIIGPCPSCYRPADVSDTDDGLVWWPCPTLRALGKEPVEINLFPVLGGSGG